MVYMTMRIDQFGDLKAFNLDEAAQDFFFFFLKTSRIKNYRLFRLIKKNVGVFVKGIESECFDLQHGKSFYNHLKITNKETNFDHGS